MKSKIDKSRIFRAAWNLVKNQGYNISIALKKVWKDTLDFYKEKQEEENYIIALQNGKTSQGCNIKPTTEMMYKFYNSNEYKGD